MTAKEIFYEAMRRTDAGDQEGFLEMFADDCHWVVPGAEFGSKEELRGWLTPFWQGFPRSGTTSTEPSRTPRTRSSPRARGRARTTA